MNTWKQRLTTNWHLMRIMRLAIGAMMLVMGIQGHDWPIGLFSIFFLYQAVTDTGCCGGAACAPQKPGPGRSMANEEVIEYEEVK